MRADQVELQRGQFFLADALGGEFAEAGIDAVIQPAGVGQFPVEVPAAVVYAVRGFFGKRQRMISGKNAGEHIQG